MFVPLGIDLPVWVRNLTCDRGWAWRPVAGMKSNSRSVGISTAWQLPCVTLRPWVGSPLGRGTRTSNLDGARMRRREVLRLLALSLLRPPASHLLRLRNHQRHDGMRELADHARLRWGVMMPAAHVGTVLERDPLYRERCLDNFNLLVIPDF